MSTEEHTRSLRVLIAGILVCMVRHDHDLGCRIEGGEEENLLLYGFNCSRCDANHHVIETDLCYGLKGKLRERAGSHSQPDFKG